MNFLSSYVINKNTQHETEDFIFSQNTFNNGVYEMLIREVLYKANHLLTLTSIYSVHKGQSSIQ